MFKKRKINKNSIIEEFTDCFWFSLWLTTYISALGIFAILFLHLIYKKDSLYIVLLLLYFFIGIPIFSIILQYITNHFSFNN